MYGMKKRKSGRQKSIVTEKLTAAFRGLGKGEVSRNLVFFFVIASFSFLIYSNTLHTPFILDDITNIQFSQAIHIKDISVDSLIQVLRGAYSTHRPLPNISFALNYYLHKFNPAGYHVVNIIIHLTTGILLFVILKDTLKISTEEEKCRPEWTAFAAVLIWIVHPLHTQSVTYIVQRMTSMATMFYALTLLLYIKARLSERKGKKCALYGMSLLSAVLALGSKEIAVTLPVFTFLYEWYFFQNLSREWMKKKVFPIIIVLVALAVLGLVFTNADPVNTIHKTYKNFHFTMGQRLLTETRVVMLYLGKMFFPHPSRLSLEHDVAISTSPFAPITTLFSIVGLLGMLAAGLLLARRQKIISFCILWFLGNLALESTIIGLDIIFEHRTYLPSLFFILVPVLFGQRLLRPMLLKPMVVTIVVILLSISTYTRNEVWSSEKTIWEDNAGKAPNNARAQMNYGLMLIKEGMRDKGLPYLLKTIEIDPRYALGYYNLGDVMDDMRKYEKAAKYYQKAFELEPGNPGYRMALAIALAGAGQHEAALFHFCMLEGQDPLLNYKVLYWMGRSLAALNRHAEAIAKFEQILRQKPNYLPAKVEKYKSEMALSRATSK